MSEYSETLMNGQTYRWRITFHFNDCAPTGWHHRRSERALLSKKRRGSRLERRTAARAAGAVQGPSSTGRATDDTSKSWGNESRQNPPPSSSTKASVRLTTIGSEHPPNQLSDEPSIGWVVGRGTGETRGEKGPDSSESDSCIYGLHGRGRGLSRLSPQAGPERNWVRFEVL